MIPSLSVFKGKRVFITGHTGFKGSWLSYILYICGARVAGFSLPSADPNSHFNLLSLEDKIEHHLGDIRDPELLKRALVDFQPEFVFHLAAQALVRPSYENPSETFSTNVIGSVNLLDAVVACPSVRSLVYITSDKCYENAEWVWGYRENDLLGGKDPYSASKAAAELVFSSYSRSFFIKKEAFGAASVRAGNVIGGGDRALDRIIPDCIRSIERGEPLSLRNPQSTRPWQHVLEPLSGYLQLAVSLYAAPKKWGGAWNFGPKPDEVRTVMEVAESVINHFGSGSIVLAQSATNAVYEANLLQLNCDKANQLLFWCPRWGVEKAIEMTSSWYKKTIVYGLSPEVVTLEQIREYFGENL